MDLREQLGDIDIYLLDQLLKGRLTPDMSLLDAGCGGGRNLVYFLREGYSVFAVDENPRAVSQVRELAARLRSMSTWVLRKGSVPRTAGS